MKMVFIDKISGEQMKKLVQRPAIKMDRVFALVKPILADVKKNGDVAVRKYSRKFDSVEIKNPLVSVAEMEKAIKGVGVEVRQALKIAAGNIEKFHREQLKKEKAVETMTGIKCWRETRDIERVGFYIPRGLVSTVLMLGVPAKIAGCQEIVMCTPLDKTGQIAPEMLLAAKIAGIKKVFKIGGAQAIAAMAYGTQTVPKVNKIFGPGNQFVMAAKMLVSIDPEGAAIDLPAGPSEVLVIGDSAANPAFVAADLLSQAEHGPDSQVILATNSQKLAQATAKEIKRQMTGLPERARKTAALALRNALFIITGSLDRAVDFANLYAPEHLILNIKNPERYVAKIKNAGSVFLGPYSPESAGDYASGTNHILPTSGWAKSYGGVSVDSFVKKISFQKLNKQGLDKIAKAIAVLADIEQMPAHKNAVKVRTTKLC